MTSVSLKINIVTMSTVRTMQFRGDQSIGEVCLDIREKIGESAGGVDHGIFWPSQQKWLDNVKTLDFYDLKSGDQIDFKKKHRPLKVKMMDETIKTILIDDSFTVIQLVDTVCKRIGITNIDEYSFAQDSPAVPKDKKKDEYTDDTKWLNPDKSLTEQNIGENDVILLKKKFFFSDQNVDRNDPIQLNLLYVQSRDAIVLGKHPCTQEESIQFAAMQCQVQFGNHEPDKHKPGFLRLESTLPPEYRKAKDIEKTIFLEHRKLQGMTELNAKFRYIQLARSLKTYGVTFFLVKEKVPKKNKLIPVLLGVTRESVMRVDYETKEVMKSWPLTTLRRWAASPHSFTLDFGDYADAYYSVQTEEGEAISQLIAGYIDIIIKKKKEADRLPDGDDGEFASLDDSVNVAQASGINIIPGRQGMANMVNLATPGMLGNGSGGPGQMSMEKLGSMHHLNGQPGKHPWLSGDNPAQQALLQNINNGFAAVNTATSDLNMATQLPPLGNDPASAAWRQQTMDVNKTNVTSQVAAHLAATAATVTLTGVDPDKMDFNAIGANISTISSNLTSLASGTKMIAALMLDPTDGEKLLEAARNLAAATSKLLQNVQPAILGQGDRQELLAAAQAIGSASSQLMSRMGNPDVSPSTQQQLLDLAKAVANATTGLVAAAKNVAGKTNDPNAQQSIVGAAKNCGSSATQLYAATAAVAPCITSQICQDQLTEATVAVDNAVGTLLQNGNACKDPAALGDLNNMAKKVKDALAALLDFAKRAGQGDGGDDIDRCADLVLASCANMLDALGDSAGIVNGAKSLAMSSTALVNLLKGLAGSDISPDERARLMAAVRALADATSKMVGVAKDAARYPDDPAKQAALRQAIEELQRAALQAAGADNKGKAFKRLMNAAKAVAASSTQLISAAKSAAPSNRNQASQLQLSQAARKVGESTANLVGGIRSYGTNPDDASNQLKLITAAKQAIAPGQALVAAGKAAAPTTADSAAQSQLLNFAKQNADDLRKLQEAFNYAESLSGDLEIDSALGTVKAVKQDLSNARDLARKNQLQPSPDYTSETAQLEIAAQSRAIGSSLAQLLSAGIQGNEAYSGVAARDAAVALQSLGNAARGLASVSSGDKDLQDSLLNAAAEIAQKMGDMIAAAKKTLTNKDPASKEALQNASKAASDALLRIVDTLPGQRDLDKAMRTVAARADGIEGELARKRPDAGDNFNSAQNKLNAAAAALSMASNNLVAASKGTPADLKKAALEYEAAFGRVVDAAGSLYALTDDKALKANIVNYIRNLAASSSKLLAAVKAVAADPNGPNLKNLLTAAARNVSDALSQMLMLCSSTNAPGQKDCDAAKQILEFASQKIQNVNDPVLENEDSYKDSLNKVLDATKAIAGQIAGLSNASRAGDGAKIGQSAKETAQQVQNAIDSAARSAYLIAVSDPSSSAGVPGLVDQDKFANALHEIKDACEKLVNPANKEPQILAAAQVIAKHTQALCGACKVASQKTSNPVATQQFVASAKTVAGFTTELVASIKALASAPSQAARSACSRASAPLIDAVENLVTFSSSPEFSAVPAKISPIAIATQRPLVNAMSSVVGSAKEIVNSARELCGNTGDSASSQLLVVHSKALTDALRNLANAMKNGSPGQREIDDAIASITALGAEIDGCLVQATIGSLSGKGISGDYESLKDSLLNNINAVSSNVDVIHNAAKNEAEMVGPAVGQMASNLALLKTSAINAAAKNPNQKQQVSLLEGSKDIADSTLSFLLATKNASSNSNPQSTAELDEAKLKLKDAVKKLTVTLEGVGSNAAEFNRSIDRIQSELANLDKPAPNATQPYATYAAELNQASKEVAETASEIVTKARTPDALAQGALKEEQKFAATVKAAQKAIHTVTDIQTRKDLRDSVRDLGGAVIKFTESLRAAAGNPDDLGLRQKITQAARDVSNKVTTVMMTTKQGSKGIAGCEEAIESINDVIADLDTAVYFADAGQMDPLDPKDTFNSCKDGLLNTAKGLVEQTKSLVGSAAKSQEELATAAHKAAEAIDKLRSEAKRAAASVTSVDKNTQVKLLNATKSAAQGMQSLLQSSANAVGKGAESPAIDALKESAKTMVTNISGLLNIVKMVGDESGRAVRALEECIADIKAALTSYQSAEPPKGTAVPDDVVLAAKLVATSAADLVSSSGRKQDDIIAATAGLKKNLEDLMRSGKAATFNAPDEKKSLMKSAVTKTAKASTDLLSAVKTVQEAPNVPANKAQMQSKAKEVAAAVNGVVEACSSLIPGGYVDPNDPNVIAERELLSAANFIDAAAKKLALLKPPERPRAANEELNFEEQILEAVKAIAGAVSALMKNATIAQREIVAQGKSSTATSHYYKDGTWSEGLVSAAKNVARATGSLCDFANKAVQGEAKREELIASAKDVSASTAQLIAAAAVKNENNQSVQRLRGAGRAVTNATDNLVKAAEVTGAFEEPEESPVLKTGIGGKASDFESQVEILRLERMLAEARDKLARERKMKYQQKQG